MNTDKLTQTNCILKYMLDGNTITSIEAINRYGTTRLSGIIYNLKKQGYNIKSYRQTVINRFGEHSSVSVYYIPKDEDGNNDN